MDKLKAMWNKMEMRHKLIAGAFVVIIVFSVVSSLVK